MATIKYVVTGEQNGAFYSRRYEMERQWRMGVLDPDTVLPALQALNEPASGKKVIVVQSLPLKTDWLQEILDAEREDHRKFFGREFDLAEFEKTLRKYGRKRIKMWQRLGMEPHFLPKVSMMFGDDYPGWKVKPERWFYEKQLEGKLLLNVNGQLDKMVTVELGGKRSSLIPGLNRPTTMAVRCMKTTLCWARSLSGCEERRKSPATTMVCSLPASMFLPKSGEMKSSRSGLERLASTRAKFGWTRLLRPMFSLNFTRICRAKTTAKPIRGYGMRNASGTVAIASMVAAPATGARVRPQAATPTIVGTAGLSALWQCSNPAQRDSDP